MQRSVLFFVNGAIKKWRKSGNPNGIHYERILDAQHAILNRQYEAAAWRFHSFGPHGCIHLEVDLFVQDSALELELWGEMLLRRQRGSEAVAKLEESMRLYRYTEWGAHAKCTQIRDKHFTLWLDSREFTL